MRDFCDGYTLRVQFAKPFFVYIIESNRPAEVQLKLNEGAALARALSFAGLACRPMTVKSKQQLAFFLSFGGPFQVHFSQGSPIVHFSGHGSDVGVQVTSGEFISWLELAVALRPLHDCTNGRFLIAMSCCEELLRRKACWTPGESQLGSWVRPWMHTGVTMSLHLSLSIIISRRELQLRKR
jgi:hypothetical protein